MGEIQFDERLHGVGEECAVENTSISIALAWGIAAELVRRHPGDLQIIETHPGGGQYSCVSVYPSPLRSPAVLDMNVDPGAHLTHASWFDRMGERFNWLEVLLAADRRQYVVEQVERAEGLHVPATSPSTTEQSVGPLLVAAFLQRTVLGRRGWTTANAVSDDDYGAGIRTDLLEHFPTATEMLGMPTDDAEIKRWYPVWFIGRSSGESPFAMEKPAFAVDLAAGRLWRSHNPTTVDLMQRYKDVSRSVDALVSSTCPPAF